MGHSRHPPPKAEVGNSRHTPCGQTDRQILVKTLPSLVVGKNTLLTRSTDIKRLGKHLTVDLDLFWLDSVKSP